MPSIRFQDLWDHHPYPRSPCDTRHFSNQCAIRMGVALSGAGVSLTTFTGAKCYPGLRHDPKHILRAEELAEWIAARPRTFGTRSVHQRASASDFDNKKGIVFIKDGWGAGDHIDVWNGRSMKGGQLDWFARGVEVWFWELE